ncbi:MAG: hypothetical protein PHR56_02725 [Dehalococcoidales bacterium]|nr:hypothetical protein [Dehalococcoidales bacterium]
MKCAAHPDVETNLTCGRCGTPICPRCMVQTPVGARCPACARLYKLPTYRVSPVHYLKASGVAVITGIIGGVVWWVANTIMPLYLGLILAAGIGYGIGELVTLSVNKKRGTGLAIIAGAGVIISYAMTIVFAGPPSGLFSIILDLVAIGIGIFTAVNRVR